MNAGKNSYCIEFAEKYYRPSAAALWLSILSVLIIMFIIIKVANGFTYNLTSAKEKSKVMSPLLA